MIICEMIKIKFDSLNKNQVINKKQKKMRKKKQIKVKSYTI